MLHLVGYFRMNYFMNMCKFQQKFSFSFCEYRRLTKLALNQILYEAGNQHKRNLQVR